MSNNVQADIPALEKANSKLNSFKMSVLNQCATLESSTSAASSFCQDEKSRLAIQKLYAAIADIRESLGAVESAKAHIRELIEDTRVATQYDV